MKRELRKYVTRIRKAQDAILNGKNTSEKKASLMLDCSTHPTTGEPTLMVYAHLSEGIKCVATKHADIGSWNYKIEEQLAEISNLIGFVI